MTDGGEARMPFDDPPDRMPFDEPERMPFDEPERHRQTGGTSRTRATNESPEEQDGRLVIASVLAMPKMYADLGFLEPDDFASAPHKAIWAAACRASRSTTAIDAESLLGIDPSLDAANLRAVAEAGGGNEASCMAAATRMSRRRRSNAAIAVMQQAIHTVRRAASNEAEDADSSWESVYTEAAMEGMALARPQRIATAASVETRIRAATATTTQRMRTGLERLDEFLGGGLRPGQMLAIGGHAKAGKTVLCATISANAERSGTRHCVVTTTGAAEYVERLKLSRRIGVNAMGLDELTPEAAGRLADLPMFDRSCEYYHYPSIGIGDLRAAMLQRRYSAGTRLFVVDRLQMISGRQRGEQAESHMNRACQMLQATAAEAGLALIVTVQIDEMARVEGYAGCIRQYADAFLVLNRDRGMTQAYLETQASNLANEGDIGSVTSPSLRMDMTAGPHFVSIPG